LDYQNTKTPWINSFCTLQHGGLNSCWQCFKHTLEAWGIDGEAYSRSIIIEKNKRWHQSYLEAWGHKALQEKLHTYGKTYREKHKEEIQTRSKAYYDTHKEEKALRKKAYYKAHQEELRAKNKLYKQKKRRTHTPQIKKWEDTTILQCDQWCCQTCGKNLRQDIIISDAKDNTFTHNTPLEKEWLCLTCDKEQYKRSLQDQLRLF
jgi:hypothetical protein